MKQVIILPLLMPSLSHSGKNEEICRPNVGSFLTYIDYQFQKISARDHPQMTATKSVARGLSNPPMSDPRNEERTRPGSLAHVIHV